MEEIRYAASEYYKGCSTEEKQKVERIFERLDENKDGKVSYEEFAAFYSSLGMARPSSEKFADIDEDGDGYLDFQEAIVSYYLNRFRYNCDVCKLYIKGMYYSCVECFDHWDSKGNPLSYDVCLTCYRAREFKHQHSSFLDNYVLFDKRNKQASRNKIAEASIKGVVETVNGATELVNQCISM